MSAVPVTNAGRAQVPAGNPTREALARVREVLRKQDSTDAEVEDALEALVELAKS